MSTPPPKHFQFQTKGPLSFGPKYDPYAMKMGLAHSKVPASKPHYNALWAPSKNANLATTRVLGAFNSNTQKGWVETNGVRKQYRKATRKMRKSRKQK